MCEYHSMVSFICIASTVTVCIIVSFLFISFHFISLLSFHLILPYFFSINFIFSSKRCDSTFNIHRHRILCIKIYFIKSTCEFIFFSLVLSDNMEGKHFLQFHFRVAFCLYAWKRNSSFNFNVWLLKRSKSAKWFR